MTDNTLNRYLPPDDREYKPPARHVRDTGDWPSAITLPPHRAAPDDDPGDTLDDDDPGDDAPTPISDDKRPGRSVPAGIELRNLLRELIVDQPGQLRADLLAYFGRDVSTAAKKRIDAALSLEVAEGRLRSTIDGHQARYYPADPTPAAPALGPAAHAALSIVTATPGIAPAELREQLAKRLSITLDAPGLNTVKRVIKDAPVKAHPVASKAGWAYWPTDQPPTDAQLAAASEASPPADDATDDDPTQLDDLAELPDQLLKELSPADLVSQIRQVEQVNAAAREALAAALEKMQEMQVKMEAAPPESAGEAHAEAAPTIQAITAKTLIELSAEWRDATVWIDGQGAAAAVLLEIGADGRRRVILRG